MNSRSGWLELRETGRKKDPRKGFGWLPVPVLLHPPSKRMYRTHEDESRCHILLYVYLIHSGSKGRDPFSIAKRIGFAVMEGGRKEGDREGEKRSRFRSEGRGCL